MIDVLTLDMIREALRREVAQPSGNYIGVIHPRQIYILWGASLAGNWKLLKLWWSMNPFGQWLPDDEDPERFVGSFWDMNDTQRINALLFWMECRPWQ